jgi:hypothetical protein
MSALTELLDKYRAAALTEREKGTYFEELILSYLRKIACQSLPPAERCSASANRPECQWMSPMWA